MEYHYVVAFNDQTKKWSLEDETLYLDGNIYNQEEYEGYEGHWFWADENNSYPEYVIDERCRTMLRTLASIWPTVDTAV